MKYVGRRQTSSRWAVNFWRWLRYTQGLPIEACDEIFNYVDERFVANEVLER